MKVEKRSPESFYYIGNKEEAILLIHGFTGSPSELRLLGEYLKNEGYTVYAPLLEGHGKTPEEMAKTNKDDWWKSVNDAYDFLNNKGYDDIIAIGLSMGGILSLKLAIEKKLIAVVSMAAPIHLHNRFIGMSRWIKYIKQFQNKKKKSDEIEQYLTSYDKTPISCADSLNKLIKEVRSQLNKITVPIQIMQGKMDETVKYESADYIYNNVRSTDKKLLWYENSTHIMTLDKEREKIFKDILKFIKGLDIG